MFVTSATKFAMIGIPWMYYPVRVILPWAYSVLADASTHKLVFNFTSSHFEISVFEFL